MDDFLNLLIYDLPFCSGRYGGFVTVYIDCQWINSFVLTKGSIELPQYPTVEVGHSVSNKRQHTLAIGSHIELSLLIYSCFPHLNFPG